MTAVQSDAELSASAAPAKELPTDAKVLVIFVDSLRPDVVDEMVAAGQLPFIKEHFYDRGLRFPNFFSTFPSLTINAFTCVLTGQWPDESGLKAQSLFERYPTHPKPLLKKMFFVPEDFPRHFNLLSKIDKAAEILRQNRVKALYDTLGEKYHPSVVPVSPSVTPWAWPHVAANEVDHPYRVSIEAAEHLDTLNGVYGLRYMVPDTRGRLFMIWFTEMDVDQHKYKGGQFAPEVRQRMIAVDDWARKIYDGLVKEDNGKLPYVVLFSDHGSYGGRDGVYNQPYYLGRDFFYQTLKMNVQGPDYVMSHPGTDSGAFTYIDNMGRGQARIFLPVGDLWSGNWERPNTLRELRQYGRGPNRKSVDLLRDLLEINLEARNEFPGKIDPHPVDLIFVKLSEKVLYAVRRGAEALIRIEDADGLSLIRYTPVKNVSQTAEGQLTFEEDWTADPFGYLRDPGFRAPNARQFLGESHNDKEWLEATTATDYPDAISALVHGLSWKTKLARLAGSQDPDLWLTATPGWNFRIEELRGADHGSLYKDSMRSTLMISGPRIRSGVDPSPLRLIDLTPTLYQLIGEKDNKKALSSVPIAGIYED